MFVHAGHLSRLTCLVPWCGPLQCLQGGLGWGVCGVDLTADTVCSTLTVLLSILACSFLATNSYHFLKCPVHCHVAQELGHYIWVVQASD